MNKMTELLYMQDSYLKEFEATVIRADGKLVVLDKTAFYPESGGQQADTGKLGRGSEEFNVISVKKAGWEITHELDREGLQAGDMVLGTIDWQRRHTLMRYHTAAHILATVVFRATGANITGNQLKLDEGRIDFNLESFDREKIKEYEQLANNVIKKELPVKIYFLPREKAFEIPDLMKLRKLLPESIKEVRIIEIEGFDIQACAGTHVKNTGEIGALAVTKAENKGKDNRRVYFRLAENMPAIPADKIC